MPAFPPIKVKELPHVGRIVQRELLSVALPGILALIETWLFVTPPAVVHDEGGFLKYASEQTSGVNTGVLLIAILLGAISAYGVGLVLRMYIWRFFEHFPPGQELPSGEKIIGKLRDDFGGDAVDGVLIHHQPLQTALEADKGSKGERGSVWRRAGKRISAAISRAKDKLLWFITGKEEYRPDEIARLLSARVEYMSYCKSWLRLHRPGLAVDHLETQINFLVTLTPPLLLSPFVIARHTAWWSLAISLPIAIFAAWCFVRLSWIRRKWEPIDAVRYFFLAHWFDEAEH